MIAFADDDRMRALGHQPSQRAMGNVNQGASRLQHVQTTLPRLVQVRSEVRGR